MRKQIYLLFLFITIFTLSACNDESIDFNISFDSNGGTTVESIQYQGEETFNIPTLVTKEGYTFDGWFLDNGTFTNPFTLNLLLDKTIDDDITLYAKWLVNQYQIIYVDDDQSVISTLTFDFGADLSNVMSPASPEKEGYTFDSWNQELPLYMPASDITLEATYQINGYVLSYIDFDETVIQSNIIEFDADISALSEPDEPQREGYTFVGWDITKPNQMPAQDVTLTATYSINQYNIHYVDSDGSTIMSIPVDFGSDLSLIQEPNNPSIYGYTFIGWSELLPATMPSHDITLEAEYTINSYTVSFRNDDESIISSETLNYSAYLSDATIPNHPTKEGYLFIGWLYHDEIWTDQKVMITDDITLYVSYELITYQVDYILNGGTFEYLSSSPVLSYTIESDSFILLQPAKEGYEFDGWYESSSYSGSPIVSITKGSFGNITLYAKWIEIIIETFDPTELNDIFGFNIYQLMPVVTTNDYVLLDYSEENFLEVYIDIFDWTENDALDYMDLLDTMLDYDYQEDSWIIGDYFLYVYEDDMTYENLIVYGIGIYGEVGTVTEPNGPFNPNTLNQSFGFDIYQMMPAITSGDAAIFDFSTNSTYEVYIDLFDWAEIDSTNYMTALDNMLVYDEIEESWILGDLYIYVYADNETYPDQMVYGVGIYGDKEVTGEPVENLSNLSPRTTINDYEKATFGQSGLPSTGTYNVLVIPVEISGTPFPSDYLSKLDLVFNGTSISTGWESVSSYYEKTSYGLLNLTFDISNKFTTNNNRSYYENIGEDGDQYAIYEALLGKDSSIDYSNYDYNNDGLIDSVIFIYSVDYDYDADPWWAWVYAAKYGQASNINLLDGLSFEYYMWASYAFLEDSLPNASSLVVNAETYIHELGHLMGAVDLYSYTTNYGPIGGLGMMDYNNGEHDPMHKLLFGWLQPKVIYEGEHVVNIESYALDDDGLNSAIIIPYRSNDFSDGNAFDEYIIIIFYTPDGLYEAHQGYDYVLDQSAIIVYHVDARMYSNTGFWEEYFVNNNDGSSSFIMQVLEVDLNNSIPSNSNTLMMSDVLTSGTFNLGTYSWNQGGSINVEIELLNPIVEGSEDVTFNISVNTR